MTVSEIIKEVPNLSLEEIKEVAQALHEAMENAEDLPEVLTILRKPSIPIPMSEIRKKFNL